ncbi:FAD:protein FMN transferase [uncultured Nocardioides sp.]|uniref:FAD:protein FMN transferase n=1 Tax=uncultured Nocardioides sp. TaxID=198441 RepID=UPI002633BC69|nr:FAD:protein FMN transferase [uncultured Nocardioides sp.]
MDVLTRAERDEAGALAQGLGSCSWTALGCGVQLLTTDPDHLGAARAAVVHVLEQVDAATSSFRPDSELSALHRADGAAVPVSSLLALAVDVALDAARRTDGLVDPTVGRALIDLGYDRTFDELPVDGPMPVTVASVPGWDRVEVRTADDGTWVRVPAGVVLDLGATAKGLAADLAADAAHAATGGGVLVGLGGDVATAGPAPAGGWQVAVGESSHLDRAPSGPEQVVGVLDGALATSCTLARRWRRGGVPLHHLVDPRSGRPTDSDVLTASVVAGTCVEAETGSTVAVLLGGGGARDWLDAAGLDARLVLRDGREVRVGRWPVPEATVVGVGA